MKGIGTALNLPSWASVDTLESLMDPMQYYFSVEESMGMHVFLGKSFTECSFKQWFTMTKDFWILFVENMILLLPDDFLNTNIFLLIQDTRWDNDKQDGLASFEKCSEVVLCTCQSLGNSLHF